MARRANGRACPPAAASLRKQYAPEHSSVPVTQQPAFTANGAWRDRVTVTTPYRGFGLRTEPRIRRCLDCGEPSVTGLCGSCWIERELTRLADSIAEQAATVADTVGPGAPRPAVREHLRPRPSRLRLSQPELELALIWMRLPERGEDGWWWQPIAAASAVRQSGPDGGVGMSAPLTRTRSPAFVAAEPRQPASRPSLFDTVWFGAFRPMPRHVREHLRPEPWPITYDALLIELRDDPPSARDVAPEIAHAALWEGEA